MPAPPGTLTDALNTVADAAEETAREQRRAAGIARRLAARRPRPADAEAVPDVSLHELLRLLSGGVRRLTAAAAQLRQGWVAALSADGVSIRQIARRLGVSHQRISALSRANQADSGSAQDSQRNR
jgi:DNA-binding NarL/FixJ family response regulator